MNDFYSQYEDVVNYLVETIGSSLTGLGNTHERVKQYDEARLIDYYEKYIYKEMNNYFLIGDSDELYIYNGCYYETHKNCDDVLLNVIKDSMKKMDVGLVYQKNSYKKIADHCKCGMRVTRNAKFEPDRNYLVFTNGVLNLETMEMNEYSMDYKTDVILDFDYNASQTYPLWDWIINVTIPNGEMRKAFQMFCGAFLANRRRFSIEYVCYLLGGGRNGKSVVTGAISNMLGENLISSFSLEELLSDNDKSYNRAKLVGKIANFSDDVKKRDYSGGAYKQLASGHKMTARNPFGRPFEVKDVPYLVVCVNEMPPTTDDTLGHYRRMLPILCPNNVDEKDADEELPAKLATKEAKAAIMNWLIEGLKMIVAAKGKIEIGESIKEEVKRQQEEGNSARRWISESAFVKIDDPNPFDSRWRSMSSWMEKYRQYCRDNSEQPKISAAVGKIFKEKGFASKRKSDGMWWCIGQLGVDTRDESGEYGDGEDAMPF